MDERLDIRLKYGLDEADQFREDAQVIQSVIGRVNRKYLILLAIHRWAEQIREGPLTDKLAGARSDSRARHYLTQRDQ